MRHSLTIAATLLCFTFTAHGSTPREDFESDELLKSATSEFFALNKEQLDAAIEYIATCGQAPDAVRNFWCARAEDIVDIKIAEAPSFSKIRSALAITDHLIHWTEPSGEAGGKKIERRVNIFSHLRRAATAQYIILMAKAKQS